jgi:OmpA-OmpF porin, OOP family
MKKSIQVALAILVVVFVSNVLADHPDHALITRYPNAVMATKSVSAFNEYNMIVGVDEAIEMDTLKLQGKVTLMRYRNPKGRSILEIFDNYQAALQEAGLKTIFKCIKKECGKNYSSKSWREIAGITVKTGNEAYYMAGKLKTKEGQQVFVALMVGKRQHQIHIVELNSMETDLVQVTAEGLAKGLDEQGFVSLNGIFFDTGKSKLKPESKAALDSVAQLLNERKKLKLYIVGHTDNSGNFESNMHLSNQRARAVVSKLNKDYGISIKRLKAQGVGPLAPRTTNESDYGKGQNRRVELVKNTF